jgi:hypothetical protein
VISLSHVLFDAKMLQQVWYPLTATTIDGSQMDRFEGYDSLPRPSSRVPTEDVQSHGVQFRTPPLGLRRFPETPSIASLPSQWPVDQFNLLTYGQNRVLSSISQLSGGYGNINGPAGQPNGPGNLFGELPNIGVVEPSMMHPAQGQVLLSQTRPRGFVENSIMYTSEFGLMAQELEALRQCQRSDHQRIQQLEQENRQLLQENQRLQRSQQENPELQRQLIHRNHLSAPLPEANISQDQVLSNSNKRRPSTGLGDNSPVLNASSRKRVDPQSSSHPGAHNRLASFPSIQTSGMSIYSSDTVPDDSLESSYVNSQWENEANGTVNDGTFPSMFEQDMNDMGGLI